MVLRITQIFLLFSAITFSFSCSVQKEAIHRELFSLNGTWEITQGSMDKQPDKFESQVEVPGLVDMSIPSFQDVGLESDRREAFWYRKTFKIDRVIPEVALLKIHKAKYGSKVYLNGKEIGTHLPNFTSGYLDVSDHLKGQGEENTIIIRVGAHRDSNPPHIPDGWDFEKIRYIPGIYDDVEFILSGSPHIVRTQVVPDIENKSILIQTVLKNATAKTSDQINFVIREKLSGEVVGSGKSEMIELDTGDEIINQTTLFFEDVHLWSPEDPFLYSLETSTSADVSTTSFGMRSFSFKDGFAYLNGKKYFMRGSNVTIYRFFEDPDREYLPWDKDWVRDLHKKFKNMNWNSLRYCIGFPPDFWYDIADEVGFLIQDEFPIWYLWQHGKFYVPEQTPNVEEEIAKQKKELAEVPEGDIVQRWNRERRLLGLVEKTKGFENMNVEELTREFTDWMNERANHPSVVLWDAQNETDSEKTAQTIKAVRHIDLSDRPWDNGWRDQEEGETYEAHPYYMRNYNISELAGMTGDPTEHPEDLYNKWRPNTNNKAFIINEYAWLWLNRDGSTTTLTDDVYKRELGESATKEERMELYINYLSGLTEYFRCHRKCAGILHFCGLGYSRPDHPRGQTSDHFTDIKTLEFEPLFAQQIKDAFSPVGLMLNFWEKELTPGSHSIDVYAINDLYDEWEGNIELRIEGDTQNTFTSTQNVKVEPLGRKIVSFTIQSPEEKGRYRLIAELKNHRKETVKSIRFFNVK